MANLTFSDLQNEVYAHTGLISTDFTNQTNVNRWLNYVQQDISNRWVWSFMFGRESITTVPDYSTGTVSISSGSSTVTGSGTTFTTTHGSGQYYIQFLGTNDWYRVTAQNSATSLTIEQPYQPSTNASAVTYVLRKIFYSLSSNADKIVDIRNWNTPLKLIQVDVRTLDDIRPNPQSTSSAYGYVTWGLDASRNLQISPYPFPSDARLLEVRTQIRPTDMVNSTDSPTIPNKYAHVISWGAIAIGFAFKKQLDMASAWSEKFESKIAEMKKVDRSSEDMQNVLRSIDNVQRSKWQRLPDQFPMLNG